MKKIYFILSLLATTVASAYAAVNPPTIGFPDNYLGDNMMKFNETFANVNHSGGKINTANPNIPAGFSVDISKNGTTDVVYYNDRDHIVLDANDDKVSTSLMVGGNLSRCIFKANLINAQGITKENSSRFKVTLYDKAGDMMLSAESAPTSARWSLRLSRTTATTWATSPSTLYSMNTRPPYT